MGTRQDKVSKQIQKDIADIILQHNRNSTSVNLLTVTYVRVTPDLGIARIYVSVFPAEKGKEAIAGLNEKINIFRNELGKKMRHQLRIIPEITFYLDDSLDYVTSIDKLLNT